MPSVEWNRVAVVAGVAVCLPLVACSGTSTSTAEGPGLHLLAELAFFESFCAFILYAQFRAVLSDRRRQFTGGLVALLFVVSLSSYLWEGRFSRRVETAAREAIAAALPEVAPSPHLAEVCLTFHGLSFWGWFFTALPQPEADAREQASRLAVVRRLAEQFPSIRSVSDVSLVGSLPPNNARQHTEPVRNVHQTVRP